MANTFKKLKKSISLRLSSLHSFGSSSSFSSNRASDLSAPDLTPASYFSGFRLSRSSSTSARCSKKTCAICLGSMKLGHGRAIFTAECSHSFHFNCIASSVKHGNHLCPICRCQWKEIPCQAPIAISRSLTCQSNGRGRVRPVDNARILQPHHLPDLQPLSEPLQFDDEDPLDPKSPSDHPPHQHMATISTFSEFPAIPASESRPGFALLVSIHAPPAHHHARAPIDLVLVLDISGSMAGTKLVLLKRAVRFVVQHLNPADRLAVVAFSSSARRVVRLQRMTSEGHHSAIMAVNSLSSGGGTNIAEGLHKGIRVLQECHQRNPVSSIVLLSDGKDTYSRNNGGNAQQQGSNLKCANHHLNPFPPSTNHGLDDGSSSNRACTAIPVHTFGFGADHDAPAMHAISHSTGGMFSFIETEATIQDAFARCIGGLLSVVAQDVKLDLTSASATVSIDKVHTGNHPIKVSDQGCRAIISIGDLYADESKYFLVYASVPVFSPHSEQEGVTPLFSVACTYKDPLSQEVVNVDIQTMNIRRPKTLTSEDEIQSLEVDRQRNRFLVADAIAEAKALAENGNLDGAQLILANHRSVLLASASAQAGDALCSWLEAELKDIRERMVNQEMYETSGRAYVLSGLSSHSWQRAATRGESMVLTAAPTGRESGSIGYETPSMANMVSRSQTLFSSPSEPVRPFHRSCSAVQRRGLLQQSFAE